MTQDWINALIGGIIIGTAVSLMLALNGRVTGISGIIAGTLSPQKGDTQWRVFFIVGLLLGGLILQLSMPQTLISSAVTPLWKLIGAGLLVGFGTLLGNGCTSGHGVCGISRLSMRSIFATLTFIAAGVATVTLFNNLGGLS